MKNLFIVMSVLSLFANSTFAASPQDEAEAYFKENSRVILLRNDTTKLTLIDRSQLGKELICFTLDMKRYSVGEIVIEDFKGQFTALVRCVDGDIYVIKGEL